MGLWWMKVQYSPSFELHFDPPPAEESPNLLVSLPPEHYVDQMLCEWVRLTHCSLRKQMLPPPPPHPPPVSASPWPASPWWQTCCSTGTVDAVRCETLDLSPAVYFRLWLEFSVGYGSWREVLPLSLVDCCYIIKYLLKIGCFLFGLF